MAKKCHYDSKLLLNIGYKTFLKNEENIIFISKPCKINEIIDILIIYNISTIDYSVIKQLRYTNIKMKCIFVYHEPWTTFFKEINRERTIKGCLKTFGRYILSRKLLKIVNEVWLPSQNAVCKYKKYNSGLNKNYRLFPLIFDDESDNASEINCIKRKYFSYIATVSYQKRFKEFLSFIEFFSKYDNSAKFLIATRSNISKYISDNMKKLIKENRLKLIHGHNLTIEDINRAYKESWCTWLLYRSSTQSGVFAKSMMLGTPCIMSSLPAFTEYVQNESWFVKKIDDNHEIMEKVLKIKNNIENEMKLARKIFIKNFSIDNNIKYFKESVDHLERE